MALAGTRAKVEARRTAKPREEDSLGRIDVSIKLATPSRGKVMCTMLLDLRRLGLEIWKGGALMEKSYRDSCGRLREADFENEKN